MRLRTWCISAETIALRRAASVPARRNVQTHKSDGECGARACAPHFCDLLLKLGFLQSHFSANHISDKIPPRKIPRAPLRYPRLRFPI
jgi:hypothetical protein